jgi:hydroxypyruvate reductase
MLSIGPHEFDLRTVGRIVVVGGGKAGAGMVRGLELALGNEVLESHRVGGLVSVPADCVDDTTRIAIRAGRPPGVNEPRPEGHALANEMLRLVRGLATDDLCICLLSGGGSALLPSPIAGLTLDQKRAVTQLLSAAGANIEQLNCVRRQISQFKGGGLARACRAGSLVTLVISDVLGDPLDVIASGPTWCNPDASCAQALEVFEQLQIADHPAAQTIVTVLRKKRDQQLPPTCRVEHVVLANNATAVDAAGLEAERLGYEHAMLSATRSEGPAEEVGRHLAEMAVRMRDSSGPNCLISGGEPTVKLADPAVRGLGGRNQQLVLAALTQLGECERIALLSGGTDGEDGPTDAAGAVVDAEVVARTKSLGIDAQAHLKRNDAYHFFAPLDALLKTGPTHTNVCDVRVVTVEQS